MSAVPIPISTPIFPRMYCIWPIWDSSRFLWSRLSHSRPMNMHCRKRIFRFSLKNMINWQPRWSAVTGKEILSISFISCFWSSHPRSYGKYWFAYGRRIGNEEFLMGNVWDGVKNTQLRDEFKCCNVYAKEKCRKCFARFYCSGGCAANSYNFHGTITDAYDLGCELQKKRIECAIMIKAAEAEN